MDFVRQAILAEEGIVRTLSKPASDGRYDPRCAALCLGRIQQIIVSYLATESVPPVLVAGLPGIGKSALISACVSEVRQEHPGIRVAYIRADAGCELSGLLRRLITELAPRQPVSRQSPLGPIGSLAGVSEANVLPSRKLRHRLYLSRNPLLLLSFPP